LSSRATAPSPDLTRRPSSLNETRRSGFDTSHAARLTSSFRAGWHRAWCSHNRSGRSQYRSYSAEYELRDSVTTRWGLE
jgi:hypothetical protein